MAIIKCKMCGGNLEITEGMTVAECEYCGTKQTVPSADSEKKTGLFLRANKLRFDCDFDRAAGIYDSIITDFPAEAEAYWGLLLCKYGIEYVDDPSTGKKVPTCHRSSFDSIMEDEAFEKVMEYADAIARRVYREEAKAIEDIRRGILEVSGKEQPYDIFICYKETDESGERTIDSVLAQDVYDALTEKGYRVFFSRITLEDKLGTEYEPYIFAALNSAKIMLVFGTDYEYFNAVWVKNEWSRYLKLMAQDKGKYLIPCYKNVDAYDMPKEFAKLQAQDMGKVGATQDLLRGIDKLLGRGAAAQPSSAPAQAAGGPTVESLLKRGQMLLEDKDWSSANEYFDKVLDIDPECAEAYVGKLCAERKYKEIAEMAKDTDLIQTPVGVDISEILRLCRSDKRATAIMLYRDATGASLMESKRFVVDCAAGRVNCGKASSIASVKNKNLENALRFASPALRAQLEGYQKAAGQARKEAARLAEEEEKKRRAEEEEKERLAEEEKEKTIAVLAARREYLAKTKAAGMIVVNGSNTVGLKTDGTVVAVGENKDGQCDVSEWTDIVAVAAGSSHTVGLRSDGTVVSAGKDYNGRYNVSDWRDIVAVAAGSIHTVGLRSDGTVVAVGNNKDGQCNVSDWTNIAAVAAGNYHTVGLRSDGTVVAVGENNFGQCNVSDWRDIMFVMAGQDYTVGLRSDGTVVAVGENNFGQCDVSDWTDIVAVARGRFHTVGLRSDGTVVGAGLNANGEYNVSEWTDIVAVAAGYAHTVGLRSDGTVVVAGGKFDMSNWTDIVAVTARSLYTVGLRSDGTVVAAGKNDKGQCNVSDWKLFNNLDTLEEERKEAHRCFVEQCRRQEEARQKRQSELEAEKAALQTELANLKGLFSGKRRKEIEAQLAKLDAELKKL